MSDNDLQLRITELPKLDHFDSNSVLPAVGRSQGAKMTGKVNFREMRSYFDLSNAYETIKDGVDATKLGDTFFVYSDGTRVFANEYQNIGGAATPVQDPKEGVIYYPTRMGIVGSLAVGATVGSFDELRNTRPLKEGVSIYLSSYYKGLNKGGGEFIGYYGKRADDGGMVAGDGSNYYWVRNTNFVTPEMFGAYGTPDKDDSAAIEGALNSGLDVQFDGSATYIANRTLVLKSIKWQQFIDGNGAWIKYSDKSRGLINEIDANGVTQRYTKFRSFFNLNLQGPATKNSKWNDVNQCDALCISYGVVENCNFYGWSNALRGFGEAYVNNCFGDDLRTAMFSCYDPGYNEITNSSVGWCSGDAIILKGGSGKAHNVDIVYAGCIDKNNEDGATALPGCIVSCGADGAGSQNIQISNISCQYFGCAGLNIQGDGVTVSGDMNLGSIYEDNFQYANQAAALWIGAKNFTIGNLHFNKVHVGVGINGNCANGSIGKIRIMSKTNLAGSTLFSATDGPNSQITKVIVDAIDFLGASTINNDVYINTDGLYLKSFYIQSLNNLQGGYTVSLRKNARIGKMILAATTSASTSPVMLIESDSVIDELEFRRNFGTALVVENNARPVIKRLSFQYKQGVAAPFVIKGDGTMTLNWGDVDMFGPSVARPQIAGKLVMNSYQGPTFRPFDAAVYAGVSYPNRSVDFVEELRMVGPAKEGDQIELKSYVAGKGIGGGNFIGTLITAPDDGGMAITGNGYSWLRQVQDKRVNVEHFGAIGDYGRITLKGTDSTVALANAIAAAKRLGYSIFFPCSKINEGYYTTKMLVMTGIMNIVGDSIRIYVASDKFDKTSGSYVLCWGNPDTDYKDISGWPNIADIHVEDVSKRASPMSGIFFKFTGGNVGRISARAFDGAGYQFGPVYDSVFAGLVTERCGNETTYSQYWRGNGDETNSITVSNILCHDAYHKGVSINGSKHNIERVHIEATATLVTDDGYTGSTKSGLTYLNHQFYLVAGTVGDLTVNDYRRSNGKTYYGDKDALDVGSHTRLVLDLSSSIATSSSSAAKSITSTFGGSNMYGYIGALSTDVYHAEPSARINIGNILVKDTAFIWESAHKVSFGRIRNLGASYGNFDSVTFTLPYVATPNSTATTNFTNCTFNGGVNGLCTGYNYFNDCTIASISLNSSATPERAKFNNCLITGNTIIDGVNATINSKNLWFSSCRFSGNVAISNIKNDGPRFTGQCVCYGTVTGWVTPNGIPVGTMCERLGPAADGDGLVYYCSKLDPTTSVSTWVPVVKFTA
ncbi:amylovoran biosynthesis protein [Serratia phage vB_SmaM-Kodama]|nr:amylovoran biosynthesis protein [Serratia phage vB_SmaM-Kodama]